MIKIARDFLFYKKKINSVNVRDNSNDNILSNHTLDLIYETSKGIVSKNKVYKFKSLSRDCIQNKVSKAFFKYLINIANKSSINLFTVNQSDQTVIVEDDKLLHSIGKSIGMSNLLHNNSSILYKIFNDIYQYILENPNILDGAHIFVLSQTHNGKLSSKVYFAIR